MTTLILLIGILAPADPLVLERVEVNRVRNQWGLSDFAGVGVVRIALDDCRYLGSDGLLIVKDVGTFKIRVVDCTRPGDIPLSDLGLIADVNRGELGHKEAMILLEYWDLTHSP